MKNIVSFLIFYLSIAFTFAQNWEKTYEKALENYKLENYTQATELFSQALTQFKKQNKEKDEDYILINTYLAVCYARQNQFAQAEKIMTENWKIVKANFKKEHPIYLQTCQNLAEIYDIQNNFYKAEPLQKEALQIIAKTKGKNSEDYAEICSESINFYKKYNQYKEAEFLLQEYKEINTILNKKEQYKHLVFYYKLAEFLRSQKRYQEAKEIYIEAQRVNNSLENWKDIYKDNYLEVASAIYSGLGLIALSLEDYKDAEHLLVQAKETLEKRNADFNVSDDSYATACTNLAGFYSNQEQYDKAEPLFKQAKKIHEEYLKKENFDYAHLCSLLGSMYFAQQRYKEAEVLSEKAYNIIKKISTQHPNYIDACENLAQVYEKLGKKQEANKLYQEIKSLKK